MADRRRGTTTAAATLVLVLGLALGVVAGCSGETEPDGTDEPPPSGPTASPTASPGETAGQTAGETAGAAPRVRTTVTTTAGDLRGRADGDVVRFEGVPYAEPPLGALRFAPPRPVEPWSGRLEATAAAPPCPQYDGTGEPVGAEDCLRLNVTAPAVPGEEPRPVMVWFPGGGFSQGDAADYDPRRLATQGDVVVVTVNYRLGTLGFLAPSGAEDGTFGLADQQEALRFVRDNAAAFGGDPGNVTAFGQSAGGSSVCYQLASPTAAGLIDRAIIQSAIDCGASAPPYAYGLPAPGAPVRDGVEPTSYRLDDIEARSRVAARGLGCRGDDTAVLSCLRALPVEALLGLTNQFLRPAVGGPVLPEPPIEVLDEVSVPVLAGFTRDESRFYAMLAALQQRPYPAGSYEPAVRTAFGERAAAVLRAYPREEYADDAEAWAAVFTDRTFACPQLVANDVLSRGTDVFGYEFVDRTAPPPLPPLPGAPASGAAHTTELPYLFDVATQPIDASGRRIPLTGPQRELADDMVAIWTDFARDGTAPIDPWADGGRVLELGPDGRSEGDPARTHRCEVWDLPVGP